MPSLHVALLLKSFSQKRLFPVTSDGNLSTGIKSLPQKVSLSLGFCCPTVRSMFRAESSSACSSLKCSNGQKHSTCVNDVSDFSTSRGADTKHAVKMGTWWDVPIWIFADDHFRCTAFIAVSMVHAHSSQRGALFCIIQCNSGACSTKMSIEYYFLISRKRCNWKQKHVAGLLSTWVLHAALHFCS